jgi:Ca2+/Na+ antiporter
MTIQVGFTLLNVHHGPLAFGGFAFVVLLFFGFYIFVLEKHITKINRFLRMVCQLLYMLFAVFALVLVMQKKEKKPDSSAFKKITPQIQTESTDTVIVKSWDMGYFDFKVLEIGDHYRTEKNFATIQFHDSDSEIVLFDCYPALTDMGAEPEKLYENIYAFPYYTGGNYSRSSGIELFRVTADTVIYIGPVCGYEDFNNDGDKEFYMYKVAQSGPRQAFDIYDTITVELMGDSLDYPFFDGSY